MNDVQCVIESGNHETTNQFSYTRCPIWDEVSIDMSVCLFVCLPPSSVCLYVRMQESDEILEINGRSTECMIHSVAITAIKTGGESVKLVVRREAKAGDEG